MLTWPAWKKKARDMRLEQGGGRLQKYFDLSQCVLDVSCSLIKYAWNDLVHRLKNKLDERAWGIGCRRPLLKSSRRGI